MMLLHALALTGPLGALPATQEPAAQNPVAERSALRVLYVAAPAEDLDPEWIGTGTGVDGAAAIAPSARAAGFQRFLAERFTLARVVPHGTPDAALLEETDVVLLDWPQDGTLEAPASPLGERDAWSKPTVLLGSAGLRTAMAWEVFGGSG